MNYDFLGETSCCTLCDFVVKTLNHKGTQRFSQRITKAVRKTLLTLQTLSRKGGIVRLTNFPSLRSKNLRLTNKLYELNGKAKRIYGRTYKPAGTLQDLWFNGRN